MAVGSEWKILAGEESTTDGLTMQDYMLLHRECAICWWPHNRPGRTLQLHHIVGGSGRKNPASGINWLCTCSRCHAAIHDRLPEYGEIPKGAVLLAKKEADGWVDEAGLAALKGRHALPYEICDIPKKFLDDRRRNGGDAWP